MKKGPNTIQEQAHYIITPFVEKNMMNLVRATSGKRFPVLIQGPTSSGKTSMIKYLADITGHKFVRINNHEHTDLQEYLGTYVTDDTGKLSFKEGVLVEALRKGYWIVLDELNLAPTDVLEALNRLLDDNRELFIPETQEVNPPGIYGGRKILSRAFRNRFLELHFDDIPQDELEIILRERCQIAPSYAKKIVEVYRQLSIERSASRLFEQKNSFATLRDLFRWALRDAVGYEQLAASGYMLLAERCRTPQEKLQSKRL
ncbi:BEM_collapsed_G0037490.mRNA.1.CDS.1 [Saccharomyces cerevisiae]|nr:BEM_collapsed_G0037490.mRNA.1.CDS.1 [Saccharomyces cerevisiae]